MFASARNVLPQGTVRMDFKKMGQARFGQTAKEKLRVNDQARASPAPRRISLLTVIAPLSNHYKKGQVDIENTAGRGRGFQVKVLRYRNLPNQIKNVTLYLKGMFTNSLLRPSMGLRIFSAPSAPLPNQTVRKRIRGRRDGPAGRDRWSRKPSHPLNGVSI